MAAFSKPNGQEEEKLRDSIEHEVQARLQAGHIVDQAEKIVKNAIQQACSDLFLAKRICDFSNDAILTKAVNGAITSWNLGAERMYGYSANEILLKPIDSIVPDEKKTTFNEIFKRVESGESISSFETVGLRRGGSQVEISVNVFPILDANGVIGTGIIARDITEIKREVLLRERLTAVEYANRELQAFTYGASHDLRAPLRHVRQLVGWLKEDLQDKLTEASIRNMELLTDSVTRMDQLIVGLLDYSRAGRGDLPIEKVSVRDLISDIMQLITPPKGFTIHLDNELPTLETAVASLHQVFLNLIQNAIQHHDQTEGVIRIQSRDVDDKQVEFTVTDDGPGISARFHEKIFELFQTLGPQTTHGVGIGLALVRKQVYAVGGTIAVESGDQRGTTFRFTWPKKVAR
jgi:PAS domain S-box-containing protein